MKHMYTHEIIIRRNDSPGLGADLIILNLTGLIRFQTKGPVPGLQIVEFGQDGKKTRLINLGVVLFRGFPQCVIFSRKKKKKT